MDWLDPTFSDPTEEREENMYSLAFGFPHRCASEWLVLRGRLPLAPKYLEESCSDPPPPPPRARPDPTGESELKPRVRPFNYFILHFINFLF